LQSTTGKRSGPSHRLVQAWFEHGAFELIVCPRLLEEIDDVLARPRLRRWLDADAATRFVATIRLTADVMLDPPEQTATTRDPDDDYLISLGRAHDADYIVTGDKDLLDWPGQRPPAITPAAFERLMDLTGEP
jgi:putative PIN family toxin of toxin-antitoxin system